MFFPPVKIPFNNPVLSYTFNQSVHELLMYGKHLDTQHDFGARPLHQKQDLEKDGSASALLSKTEIRWGKSSSTAQQECHTAEMEW